MIDLLIKKAKKGDKDSLSQAIMAVKDDAYRVAYCYLHNQEDSMDAVCDAVEKAMVNLKKLKEPKYFKTWFIRIVINEAKMQLRQKQKVISLADSLYVNDSFQEKQREDIIDLEKMLGELEPLDRLLIYMKYYLGYTLDEIALSVDLPLGTVKTKIYGNLKVMRDKLELREV
ncbi:sigma-70 family RNA polymerase sigma factor [Dethiobacter alkaliphilus]|uniref:sigma-70 family RNA polymerase sigma factor n=1 Tax=Dethiobacter alkaliphilus TaxID=427926 RepID=UPI002226AD7A|nr:sigma-70 family RNA polymerase sigma factor [Dethiobacter alkaliphilus]MCW3489762.1 sigma-70 family RNA polymerase sigma factor [Dethiobacter alkaliphilus]